MCQKGDRIDAILIHGFDDFGVFRSDHLVHVSMIARPFVQGKGRRLSLKESKRQHVIAPKGHCYFG